MSDKITDRQITARLEENGLRYEILPLQNDVFVIISQRGGRIFGPFLSESSESVFWMNDAFAQPESFKEFLESGSWNLGGDRIWIAPEIQYGVQDRDNYWGSITWPPQVDPGTYAMEQLRPDEWLLSQDIALEAFNLATGTKELHLERLIRRAEDPLRNLSAYPGLVDGVTFAGYEQVISLSERKLDDIVSEAWNLVQLNPGGLLLIPASPRLEFTDYYAPIGDLHTIYPNHVRLQITGSQQYKVGYKAAHLFGRMAYFNHFDDGRAYLIVRNYFNNPSMPYAEEPDHTVGRRGHSVHVYNDTGDFGGFGEMECNLQTIGGETDRSTSTDQLVLWLYVGEEEKIREIAVNLVGVEV